MSIYGRLLQMALETEPDYRDRPVADLVALAVRRKAALAAARGGVSDQPGTAEAIGDALAYDAALVRLCERLGVGHELTEATAGLGARWRAEQRLASRLPALTALMSDPPARPIATTRKEGSSPYG